LIAAGSGALTFGSPDSPGVTKGTAKDTLIVPFNDLQAIETIIEKNPGEIAAIILEPVVGNMGCVIPLPGYLQGLRKLCDQHNIILIFDEVMTGFRLSLGGAQELYDVKPDMTTLGKIIGGGLPVGAYGGRRDIMDSISPVGPIYQAGTLSGNPLAMAAGLTMLSYLKQNPSVYKQLDQQTAKLVKALKRQHDEQGLNYTINQVGSMFTLFFTDQNVINFHSAKASDTTQFASYFQGMLQEGIYLAPSQFEAMFISTAINDGIIDRILEASKKALKNVKVSI
jgi:glutamate-1-semialdehyde 2,1-aminomutase